MSAPLLMPQIAVDEADLRTALESVAIPGFTGSLSVEIGLRPTGEGKSFVIAMVVSRKEYKRPGANGSSSSDKQVLPDPERKKPVQNVMDEIRTKLFVRPILQALEVQFDNGKVMKYSVAE